MRMPRRAIRSRTASYCPGRFGARVTDDQSENTRRVVVVELTLKRATKNEKSFSTFDETRFDISSYIHPTKPNRPIMVVSQSFSAQDAGLMTVKETPSLDIYGA